MTDSNVFSNDLPELHQDFWLADFRQVDAKSYWAGKFRPVYSDDVYEMATERLMSKLFRAVQAPLFGGTKQFAIILPKVRGNDLTLKAERTAEETLSFRLTRSRQIVVLGTLLP